MKRGLPLVKKARKPTGDTITRLMQLGFRSGGPGHWTDGKGNYIYECGGEMPYMLVRGADAAYFPALIAVYQELVKPNEAAG